MHRWFLGGVAASGLVVAPIVGFAVAFKISALEMGIYLIVVMAAVNGWRRRRMARGRVCRSRELRCRFPTDPSARLRHVRNAMTRRRSTSRSGPSALCLT
jgi:hypothetical protein